MLGDRGETVNIFGLPEAAKDRNSVATEYTMGNIGLGQVVVEGNSRVIQSFLEHVVINM